eukprot:TRINITY_DN46320_c0_g1_i1.p1 TRINITY_DN46320_c0_g1~~TRINITY_DN46320_c0_g1_i1.p1  ORF type:complete len:1101 (-),score=239.40 TRINITY_DN46320_c0_g1_i1:222-3524(-)
MSTLASSRRSAAELRGRQQAARTVRSTGDLSAGPAEAMPLLPDSLLASTSQEVLSQLTTTAAAATGAHASSSGGTDEQGGDSFPLSLTSDRMLMRRVVNLRRELAGACEELERRIPSALVTTPRGVTPRGKPPNGPPSGEVASSPLLQKAGGGAAKPPSRQNSSSPLFGRPKSSRGNLHAAATAGQAPLGPSASGGIEAAPPSPLSTAGEASSSQQQSPSLKRNLLVPNLRIASGASGASTPRQTTTPRGGKLQAAPAEAGSGHGAASRAGASREDRGTVIFPGSSAVSMLLASSAQAEQQAGAQGGGVATASTSAAAAAEETSSTCSYVHNAGSVAATIDNDDDPLRRICKATSSLPAAPPSDEGDAQSTSVEEPSRGTLQASISSANVSPRFLAPAASTGGLSTTPRSQVLTPRQDASLLAAEVQSSPLGSKPGSSALCVAGGSLSVASGSREPLSSRGGSAALPVAATPVGYTRLVGGGAGSGSQQRLTYSSAEAREVSKVLSPRGGSPFIANPRQAYGVEVSASAFVAGATPSSSSRAPAVAVASVTASVSQPHLRPLATPASAQAGSPRVRLVASRTLSSLPSRQDDTSAVAIAKPVQTTPRRFVSELEAEVAAGSSAAASRMSPNRASSRLLVHAAPSIERRHGGESLERRCEGEGPGDGLHTARGLQITPRLASEVQPLSVQRRGGVGDAGTAATISAGSVAAQSIPKLTLSTGSAASLGVGTAAAEALSRLEEIRLRAASSMSAGRLSGESVADGNLRAPMPGGGPGDEAAAEVRELLMQLEQERLRCASLNHEVERQIVRSNDLWRQLKESKEGTPLNSPRPGGPTDNKALQSPLRPQRLPQESSSALPGGLLSAAAAALPPASASGSFAVPPPGHGFAAAGHTALLGVGGSLQAAAATARLASPPRMTVPVQVSPRQVVVAPPRQATASVSRSQPVVAPAVSPRQTMVVLPTSVRQLNQVPSPVAPAISPRTERGNAVIQGVASSGGAPGQALAATAIACLRQKCEEPMVAAAQVVDRGISPVPSPPARPPGTQDKMARSTTPPQFGAAAGATWRAPTVPPLVLQSPAASPVQVSPRPALPGPGSLRGSF